MAAPTEPPRPHPGPPPPRPKIIVLVGLPGSGKTTYLEQLRAPTLSSDTLRLLLGDNQDDQTIHPYVFAALRYLLSQRLAIGRPITYLDATHLTPFERNPYFEIARRYNADIEALFFDVPVDVCKQRNRRRPRVVPDDVIDRMAARLVPPTTEEGFTRVQVISP